MQALVFDFDGTLVDTETPELTVWTEIFAERGVAMPEGYWANLIGRGAEQEFERPAALLERLTGKPFTDVNRRHERIMALIDEEPVRPGVKVLLQEARERGLALAVASSSKHEWVDRELDKRRMRHLFDAVLCADDVARAKPFPDLYLLACERLGSLPLETVAFEDSPNGLAAARAAGLLTVATPNPVTIGLDLSAADLWTDDLSLWRLDALSEALVQRRGDDGRLPR